MVERERAREDKPERLAAQSRLELRWQSRKTLLPGLASPTVVCIGLCEDAFALSS